MNGWHTAVYKARVVWIALARRTPFPRGCFLLGPEGGKFAFGQTRDEAMENLRAEIGG